jgi:hypothetical protein
VNEPVRFYAYVEIDKSVTPPLPKSVSLTRAEARAKIDERAVLGEDVTQLRVRRAKVTTFES